MKLKLIPFVLLVILTGCGQQTSTEDTLFRPMDIGRDAKVSCFEAEPNGGLWMGLDGEGLAYRESASAAYQYYNKLSGTLPSDVVICTYHSKSGRQWFGTFGNGFFYWDGKTFQLPEHEQLRNLEYIAGFAESTDGSLWIATQKEGLARCDTTGNVRYFNQDNSPLPTNWLADLKTLDHQTLYIATGWGLFTLDTRNDSIAPLRDEKGEAFLAEQLIRILLVEDNGTLWIGTRTGLYIYQTGKHTYRHLTTDDGLGDDMVKGIARDRQGNIWITGEESVTMIEPAGYTCRVFRPKLNGATFHVRAVTCTADGHLLFGTSKGVMTVTPSEVPPVSSDKPIWHWVTIIGQIVFVCIIVLLVYRWSRRRHAHSPIETSKLSVTSVDEQFKKDAIRTVEEHLDDVDFGVEELSSALGISRGYMYKRLMTITGKTPVEFIRKIRIMQGRQLLEQSGDSVSQVAWRVGLSPKQFSKYFKEEYGLLPSDFQKAKKQPNTP